MKRVGLLLVLVSMCLFLSVDAFGRGGRGGFGGGGGGARMGGGGGGMARPSMSRPPAAMSRPVARTPSVSRPSVSRPSVSNPIAGARPGVSRPSINPPNFAARPGVGTRPTTPGIGTRPGVGTRPSAGDLQNFLDLGPGGGRPSTLPSNRPGNLAGSIAGGVAGGIAGGAAADFLRDSGARPGTLPADRPGIGNRPGIGDRPGVGDRPGIGDRPGVADRPALADRPLASNRPDRIENRGQRQENRSERRDEIRDYCDDHPIRDFWSDHPLWGAWAISRPFRWAAWGGVTGWVDYGWTEPIPYSYGENVYYQDGNVYYGDEPVATEAEYAAQAEAIAASGADTPPEKSEWMPLGVFALTPDGQKSGPEPTLFLQLAISKEGIIAGTLNDSQANTTQTIEGAVDKGSQRSAWNVVGKTRPIMETGIHNLTQDTAPALVHFADGTTQQWLMVRLNDPQSQQK